MDGKIWHSHQDRDNIIFNSVCDDESFAKSVWSSSSLLNLSTILKEDIQF